MDNRVSPVLARVSVEEIRDGGWLRGTGGKPVSMSTVIRWVKRVPHERVGRRLYVPQMFLDLVSALGSEAAAKCRYEEINSAAENDPVGFVRRLERRE